ncbi:MAG: DciA family protein [Sulfuriferula sp.]|nr:DciA family protein [Sulfuriferula sp.]
MTNFPAQAQRAYRFINADDRLRLLQTHVNEIVRLQKLWHTIVPAGLAGVSRIGQIDADTISIYCDHGAAAAKLRQLIPSISTALAKQGFMRQTVLIKVRTNAIPDRYREIHKPVISPGGLTELTHLYTELEAGTLKEALARLLSKHRNE